MNANYEMIVPEHTAVRVALWRALHVSLDSQPHVFEDILGAKIVGKTIGKNVLT